MGRKQIIKRNYDNEGNLISKECSCCHKIKSISEFNKAKRELDKLQLKCKECLRKYRQENKEHMKEYKKIYNQENKEKIKEKKQKYYQEKSDYIKEKSKKYYQENKEFKIEYQKEYYKNNLDTIKEKQKQYAKDNADKIKEYYKEYRENNKEVLREKEKQYAKNNAIRIKEYKKEYKDKKVQQALQQIKKEIENNPNKYNYIKGKEIYGIIYLVHNTESNKYYVGQTTIGFDNRYPSGWLYDHGHKNSVKEDLELYGENSFEYVKLFKVAHSQYELDKLEAYYIDYYDSYENGYNETRGNIFTDRGKGI